MEAKGDLKNRLPKTGAIFEEIASAPNEVSYIRQLKKSTEKVNPNGARTISQAKRARRFVVQKE